MDYTNASHQTSLAWPAFGQQQLWTQRTEQETKILKNLKTKDKILTNFKQNLDSRVPRGREAQLMIKARTHSLPASRNTAIQILLEICQNFVLGF